ncbi:MAG: hypothetical protein HY074_14130 [Deltaproteobacteria bacterium]|nr:hypothetical protein [Deltaproteobacteria bacterium]
MAAFAGSFASAQTTEPLIRESQLMGVYQSCFLAQSEELHSAVFKSESYYDRRVGTEKSSYVNPFIGAAHLNVVKTIRGVGGIYDRVQYYELAYEFEYRNGRIVVEARNYSSLDCRWDGECDTVDLVRMKPFYLPFYKYKTQKRVAEDYVKGGLQLMTYQGPSRIPFQNDDTGRPILGTSGKPIEFDVDSYKQCLKRGVASFDVVNRKAAKQAAAGEVAAVEDGGAPKLIAPAQPSPRPGRPLSVTRL